MNGIGNGAFIGGLGIVVAIGLVACSDDADLGSDVDGTGAASSDEVAGAGTAATVGGAGDGEAGAGAAGAFSPESGGEPSVGGTGATSAGGSAGATPVGGTGAASLGGAAGAVPLGGTGATSAGGSAGATPVGGTGAVCGEIVCDRPIECVTVCGGEILQSGCCPCPEGTFDGYACGTGGAGGSGALTEDQLDDCDGGTDCIVVPYAHCCGATKRAIRSDALAAYESHPEWQVYDDPATCAVIGMCLPDEAVEAATCSAEGQCVLVFPSEPTTLTVGDLELPPEFVTMTTAASMYVGGIDRVVLDFVWSYDDPASVDEAEEVSVTLGVQDPQFSLTAEPQTFNYPIDPFEWRGGTWTRFGVAVLQSSLSILSGTITIRDDGGTLVGEVRLELETTDDTPVAVYVAGPFSVASPAQ